MLLGVARMPFALMQLGLGTFPKEITGGCDEKMANDACPWCLCTATSGSASACIPAA
jgi:hypothetical protein